MRVIDPPQASYNLSPGLSPRVQLIQSSPD